jgi:DNA invertase Pin-like site-specific DNA recombinase
MTSKSIGYARLNSDFLSEDISFVFENVTEVYQDIGDVETDHRPEFEWALEKISEGDEVVIYQMSQLGNNLISLQ